MGLVVGLSMSKGVSVNRWAWILLVLGLAACQPADNDASVASDQPAGSAVPTVYTVNYPLAWMAERIGGDAVDVEFPAPQDVDPAHWQPPPQTVLDYQGADRVLLNGAGYAGWIQLASLSPGRLVDTTRGLEARFVSAGEVTHSHGPGGGHEHGDVASHTWLDPTLAAEQARAVAEALSELTPDREAEFQERLATVQAELRRLDERARETLCFWRNAGVLYSHPVYQYLDARYALGGRSLTWEPGEDPGEAEWGRLSERLSERPAMVMLWEGEPLPATAARLRGMGVEPVVFETGAVRPAEGDYLTLMNRNLEWAATVIAFQKKIPE